MYINQECILIQTTGNPTNYGFNNRGDYFLISEIWNWVSWYIVQQCLEKPGQFCPLRSLVYWHCPDVSLCRSPYAGSISRPLSVFQAVFQEETGLIGGGSSSIRKEEVHWLELLCHFHFFFSYTASDPSANPFPYFAVPSKYTQNRNYFHLICYMESVQVTTISR